MPDRAIQPPIYLDNNSTTPVDPLVLEAMLPYFTTQFANPSNTLHTCGAAAAEDVEMARSKVASAIGADAREIIFTSGATESNNLAILGSCRYNQPRYNHAIVAITEHKAVLEPCRELERTGFGVTYLAVDKYGHISLDQLEESITPTTLLVSLMVANNEIGTISPMKEIGEMCRRQNVLFHSDAAQAMGRISIDVDDWGVDMLSLSAHKAYGPKGVGALYVRQSSRIGITPLIFGGGQERSLRSGTLPVPQIVGMGLACQLAVSRLESDSHHAAKLRDQLQTLLRAAFSDAVIHGHPDQRLPGLLNIGFLGLDGDVFVQLLRGVAASQGSSCSAGSFEPSHVLRAVGVSDNLARSSLRLGVGRFTTEVEIQKAATLIADAVDRAKRV